MIEHFDKQGCTGWLESRKGVITGSRAKDTRDRGRDGKPSAKMLGLAMDVAREREGGSAAPVFASGAMKIGQDEEPFARIAYMAQTGHIVDEVGFFTTDDRKFGQSLDGRVGTKGAIEIKAMVSSATLFKAMVDGDISDYRDQCLFALWLFSLDWVDLCLWAPDLQQLVIIRIERDEAEIQRLEDDLMAFEKLVSSYQSRLHAKLQPANAPLTSDTGPDDVTPPWAEDATPPAATPAVISTPTELPISIF